MSLILTSTALLFIFVRLFIFKPNTEKNDKRFLFFVVIALTLIFGSRNAILDYGSDLNNYYRCFDRAITYDKAAFFEEEFFETGYLWINWILSRFIKWPQFIIYFQMALCSGLTCRFIYKHTNDPLFSVLAFMSLGVLQFYTTGFRQAIAISICLIAIEFAERKRIVGFIIVVLLASTVHQTSIVFIIAYLLINLPVNLFTAFFDISLGVILLQIVPRLMEIGNEQFDMEYIMSFDGNKLGGIINILIALIPIVIIIASLITGKAKQNNNFNGEILDARLFHLLLIGVFLYALRYQSTIIERISFYFTPVLIVMLPKTISYGFPKYLKVIVKALFFFVMFFLVYWRFKGAELIPFWDEQILTL